MVMDVQVELRIKAMQPVLIPDLYRHLLGATVIEIWDQRSMDLVKA